MTQSVPMPSIPEQRLTALECALASNALFAALVSPIFAVASGCAFHLAWHIGSSNGAALAVVLGIGALTALGAVAFGVLSRTSYTHLRALRHKE